MSSLLFNDRLQLAEMCYPFLADECTWQMRESFPGYASLWYLDESIAIIGNQMVVRDLKRFDPDMAYLVRACIPDLCVRTRTAEMQQDVSVVTERLADMGIRCDPLSNM